MLFMNPQASNYLGLPYDEIVAEPFADFIHTDDRTAVSHCFKKIVNKKRLSEIPAVRLINKSNETVRIELFSALIDWEGKPAVLAFLRAFS
jgi:hypothetical protein